MAALPPKAVSDKPAKEEQKKQSKPTEVPPPDKKKSSGQQQKQVTKSQSFDDEAYKQLSEKIADRFNQ